MIFLKSTVKKVYNFIYCNVSELFRSHPSTEVINTHLLRKGSITEYAIFDLVML